MNFFKNAKLQLWYALNDSPVFKTNVRRWLRILKLEQSFYYPDCIKFYSGLDFAGKGVLDIGSDFGTSPMYFLGNNATFVVGISLDSQYFHDPRYTHYQVKKEELKMEMVCPLNTATLLAYKDPEKTSQNEGGLEGAL